MLISMVNAQAILFCQLSDMLFNYMGSLCLCVSSEPLTTSESRSLSMNKIEQVLSQTSPRTSLISTRCALRWSVGEPQTEKVDCAKLFLVTYTCATPFVEQLSSIPSKPLVGDCRVLCNPLLPPGTRIKQRRKLVDKKSGDTSDESDVDRVLQPFANLQPRRWSTVRDLRPGALHGGGIWLKQSLQKLATAWFIKGFQQKGWKVGWKQRHQNQKI